MGQVVGVDVGVAIPLIATAAVHCVVLVSSISIIRVRMRSQSAVS